MIKTTTKYKNNPIRLDFLPEEEKEEFSILGNLKSGKYFALEAGWFDKWIDYLNGGQYPGPVKTQGLMDRAGFRRDLRYPKDYKVVNLQQWIFLFSKYNSESPIELTGPFELNIVPSPTSVAHYLSAPVTTRNGLDTLVSVNSCIYTENTIEVVPIPENFPKNVGFIRGLDSHLQYSCLLNALMSINAILKLVYTYKDKRTFIVFHRVVERMTKERYSIIHSAQINQFITENFGNQDIDPWEQVLNQLDFESQSNSFSSLVQICVENQKSCKNSCEVSKNLEKILSLNLEVNRSLQESLKIFEEPRKTCDKCGKCGEILVKKSEALESSEIICFKLCRLRKIPYLYQVFSKVKYRKNIKFCGKNYTLASVISHDVPAETNSFSLTCKKGKSWYLITNAEASKLSLKDALNKIALILIYTKV